MTDNVHNEADSDLNRAAAVIRDFILNSLVRDTSASLTLEMPLRHEGLLDSMRLLELLTFIETSFDVRLPDYFGTSPHCVSVASIAAYICREGSKR